MIFQNQSPLTSREEKAHANAKISSQKDTNTN